MRAHWLMSRTNPRHQHDAKALICKQRPAEMFLSLPHCRGALALDSAETFNEWLCGEDKKSGYMKSDHHRGPTRLCRKPYRTMPDMVALQIGK